MNTIKLSIVRFIFHFIPISRGFSIKRVLLRWCGAKVGGGSKIYSNVKIFGNGQLVIGEDTFIGHEVMIVTSSPATITLGARVDIAPNVFIGTGSHQIDWNRDRVAGTGTSESIVIEDECWLGVGCKILPGVLVGKHTVIAAAAVVNKSLPPNIIAAGIPARVIMNPVKLKSGPGAIPEIQMNASFHGHSQCSKHPY